MATAMTRYLHHVTLNTGHSRRSYRSEVSDVAVAAVQDSLTRALAASGARAMILPGYDLTAAAQGQALVATIWREQTPLVTLGVALNSRSGAGLWPMLHAGTTGLMTAGTPRPPAPWLAARIEPSVSDVTALHWIADYERVLAWAWVSRIEAIP